MEILECGTTRLHITLLHEILKYPLLLHPIVLMFLIHDSTTHTRAIVNIMPVITSIKTH
jgi:hypothetical protein